MPGPLSLKAYPRIFAFVALGAAFAGICSFGESGDPDNEEGDSQGSVDAPTPTPPKKPCTDYAQAAQRFLSEPLKVFDRHGAPCSDPVSDSCEGWQHVALRAQVTSVLYAIATIDDSGTVVDVTLNIPLGEQLVKDAQQHSFFFMQQEEGVVSCIGRQQKNAPLFSTPSPETCQKTTKEQLVEYFKKPPIRIEIKREFLLSPSETKVICRESETTESIVQRPSIHDEQGSCDVEQRSPVSQNPNCQFVTAQPQLFLDRIQRVIFESDLMDD